MTWQSVTALVVVGLAVLVVVYDLVAYAAGGDRATVSDLVLRTADRYRGFAVLLALVVGVLVGHLLLPQTR